MHLPDQRSSLPLLGGKVADSTWSGIATNLLKNLAAPEDQLRDLSAIGLLTNGAFEDA